MKKCFFIIFALFLSSFGFSKPWNIYEGADKATISKIEECDALIKNKSYLSAANKVASCENEYIIYKYIEVCTQYFVTSINHQMFAFKNLGKDEDLMELRKSGGEFTISYYDEPEKIIEDYRNKKGESLVLNLALANYYFDAISRYGNNWIKEPSDVLDFILNTYEQALEEKVYDSWVLQNYSNICLNISDFSTAENVLNILTKKYPENGTYWYNYSVTLMYEKKYKEAIPVIQQVILHPEEDDSLHFDYYLLLSDAYAFSGDLKNAEKTAIEATKKFGKDSRSWVYLGEFYISFEECLDLKKAETNFLKALEISADEDTLYYALDTYYNASLYSDAITFCEKALKKAKDENLKGFLYYYLPQFVYLNSDGNPSSDELKKINDYYNKAEECFTKTNNQELLNSCKEARISLIGE